jgi:glutathione S-transferase
MLVYVAQSFPKAGLAPMDDPFLFAEIQSINSWLCSHLHVAHAHRMRGHRWVDADDAHSIAAMQRKVPQSVGDSFAMIEQGMLKGPWVMGERYTICDPYLFTLAQWLEADGVDPARIPRVIDHRRRVGERAATRKSIAQELAPA